MGIHSAVIDSASDEGSVYQLSVCCSGFDIRLRAPFERHEEVGGWESLLHGRRLVRFRGFVQTD